MCDNGRIKCIPMEKNLHSLCHTSQLLFGHLNFNDSAYFLTLSLPPSPIPPQQIDTKMKRVYVKNNPFSYFPDVTFTPPDRRNRLRENFFYIHICICVCMYIHIYIHICINYLRELITATSTPESTFCRLA